MRACRNDEGFSFDDFLSLNAKYKRRWRGLAERLKQAALRVWLDEWIIKPGDHTQPSPIGGGLDASRVLLQRRFRRIRAVRRPPPFLFSAVHLPECASPRAGVALERGPASSTWAPLPLKFFAFDAVALHHASEKAAFLAGTAGGL
jgi:hypothetical protein